MGGICGTVCGFINVNSYNNRVAIFKETKTVIVYYKMGSCIFIVWAWWYIYILKSKLIGNPVMVKIYFVISVLVGLIVVIQLGIKYWEKINRPENLF